ncbi:hypothetical protein [Paenarthrobacter sp.]|uniref:hypothetical protein n=1 Tax=Paenarthrobacter sp. TaxID=1931993 RepID=UPI00281278F6|nr:hypothetical protein [Paenarthrobacter sp.]
MEWATQQTLEMSDLGSEAAYGEQFAVDFVRQIATKPQLQFFQYEMLLSARHQPQMRATVERLYTHYMQVISKGFEQRGFAQPNLLACVLFAATDGLVMQQLTFARRVDIEQAFILLGQALNNSPTKTPSPPPGATALLWASCRTGRNPAKLSVHGGIGSLGQRGHHSGPLDCGKCLVHLYSQQPRSRVKQQPIL